MRNFHGIKAQDIILLMKLVVHPGMSQKDLAQELSISTAEISHGMKRLKVSQLMNQDGSINKEAVIEFLVHGLKYIFPAEFGTLGAGIPTAYAKPAFKYVRYKKDDIYVWSHPQGNKRGIILKPIYPTLPDACLSDDQLYTLAALAEMIRMGRAREKNIAAEEIAQFIRNL